MSEQDHTIPQNMPVAAAPKTTASAEPSAKPSGWSHIIRHGVVVGKKPAARDNSTADSTLV